MIKTFFSYIFGDTFPLFGGDTSNQDQYEVQSFVAPFIVIGTHLYHLHATDGTKFSGIPLVTGLMSFLGVAPAVIIGLSWLAPLVLTLLEVPGLTG